MIRLEIPLYERSEHNFNQNLLGYSHVLICTETALIVELKEVQQTVTDML